MLALDWAGIGEAMREEGYALLPSLLSPEECAEISGTYADDTAFRSHIVMSRFGFGRGEYKYFEYPLPGPVADLREYLYPHLVRIANSWTTGEVLPEKLSDYLELCRIAGQCKPHPAPFEIPGRRF